MQDIGLPVWVGSMDGNSLVDTSSSVRSAITEGSVSVCMYAFVLPLLPGCLIKSRKCK
jgi:hypothetical protein